METGKFSPIKWDFEDISYGPDNSQAFDIVIHKEKKEAHGIVYIHGGAYIIGDKSEYPSFLTDFVKDNVVATINYRVINENNNINMRDMLADIDSALTKIIELSEANSVCIKDFILVGHSAGGHIALLFGYLLPSVRKIRIAACVSLAGPTDFSDDLGWSSVSAWGPDLKTRLAFFSQVGSRLAGITIKLTQGLYTRQKDYSDFKQYFEAISPITYISKAEKIPPTLLVHARSDNQVPYSNAVRLKAALDRASVPNKLITAAGSGNSHMLGGVVYTANSPFVFENQAWVREAVEWVGRYLG